MRPPWEPLLRAVAPIRVADLGGWTDTWFAGHGLVCNVAVQPGAEVRISTRPGAGVEVVAADFGDRYRLEDGRGRHPLLEATIDEVGVPRDLDLEVTVRCPVPPGASTGTSASVTVALAAALLALRSGAEAAPGAVAATAHRVEAVRLGRQTGIQDQLCSAHGGINLIRMHEYPEADVEPVPLASEVEAALERRLVLVFLGRTHVSSEVHEQVIAELEAGGAAAHERLEPLRATAAEGHAALRAGDLEAYGRALSRNTEAQAALHPGLVDREAWRLIDVARAAGAAGWKVNGAGGAGGSVTLLAGADDANASRITSAVAAAGVPFVGIPVRLDRGGVRVEWRDGDGYRPRTRG